MSNPIGSVLNIPPTLLSDLTEIDKKVNDLQKSSTETASVFNASFASMTADTKLLNDALSEVLTKMQSIQTASSGLNAGSTALTSLANSASSVSSSITQASESINHMSSAAKQSGTQAADIIKRMLSSQSENYTQWKAINDEITRTTARQNELNTTIKSYEMILSSIKKGKGGTISNDQMNELKAAKQEYEANKQLIDGLRQKQQQLTANSQELQKQVNLLQQLRTASQGSLANDRSADTLKRMGEYYRELEKSSARQAKEAERTAEKQAKEAERAAKAQQKAEEQKRKEAERTAEKLAKEAEKAEKAQRLAYSTSYSGSMKEAESATTINQRAQAVRYLEAARAKLSTTDSDYSNKLFALNTKIKELNKANREAIADSQELNHSHQNLMDTVGQLKRAFALLFSVSQLRDFAANIARVRGEFELQQRSLQAILQNKSQADAIYNKTLALALESPFRAKELITFTKQLAAYRIESDKLFDTTKRLADVSAGLGVDMQRLILAYGQVKAAAYLRGTEVRQFTEAGINIYGELQAYFKEVKGEAYTTAQIVDMISKRKVTFEDIEQIFKRLTDEGGLFYNMQKIQVETLQGKLGKLRDAYDQMLNAIGKDNEGLFKGAVDAATLAVQNWEKLASVGKAILGVMLVLKVQSMRTGVAMSSIFSPKAIVAGKKLDKGIGSIVSGLKLGVKSAKNFGMALKTAFASNIWLVAISMAVEGIMHLIGKINEYEDSLNEINKDFYEHQREILKLKKAYEETADASSKSAKAEVANTQKKREALEKLVNLMKEKNFVISFDVKDIPDNKLKEVFDENLEAYQNYLSTVKKIKIDVAANVYETNWSDDVKEDIEDYTNEVSVFLTKAREWNDILSKIDARRKFLPEQAKALFDNLKITDFDENNLNEVIERYEKLLELAATLQKDTVGRMAYKYEIRELQSYIKNLQAVKSAQEELFKVTRGKNGEYIYEGELAKPVADLQAKYREAVSKGISEGLSIAESNKRAVNMLVKPTLDQLEADGIINEFSRKLIESIGGSWSAWINISDEENLNQQLKWIDKYIEDFLSSKSYKISIYTNTDTLEDFVEQGDEMVKKVKKIQEFITRLSNSKGTVITVDDKIKELMKNAAGVNFEVGVKIDKNKVIEAAKELLRVTKETAVEGYGVDASDFITKNQKAAKQQRDILSEQVALLKEMQQRYEKLTPLMGAEKAAKRVRDYYAESLRYVKMPQNIANAFVPTKEGLSDALKKLIPAIKDFKKRMDAQNMVAELKIEIDKQKLDKEIEQAKKQLETAFSSIDLYTELSKLGIGEGYIRSLFGDIPKNFSEVQAQLNKLFEGKEGEQWTKAREEAEKQLTEKMQKYNLDMFKELTNAYKTQLSDQLQLDRWYTEERTKILNNTYLSKPEAAGLRASYLDNLDKLYNKKKDENAWKEFKGSDFYIRLFENVEAQSEMMTNAMLEKLRALKDELQNLSPEQLKEVVRQMELLEGRAATANPFKTLFKELPNALKNLKDRNRLEREYLDMLKQEEALKKQTENDSKDVDGAQQYYDYVVRAFGVDSEAAKVALEQLEAAKDKLGVTKANLEAQQALTKSKADEVDKTKKSIENLKAAFGEISKQLQNVSSGYGDFEGMMENFGVKMPKEIAGTLNGLQQISDGVKKILDGDIVGGVLSAVAGIGNTIGSIFGFGNKDKKLQKQIDRQQKKVERLQRAYENLSEAMDKAWDSAETAEAYNASKQNLEEQIRSYEAMAKAEEDKKHTDNEQLQEYRDNIEDLKKQLKELEEQQIQAFGGIGDSNYKDAAQEFADAWLDAYNEFSDTLSAIQNKMDDFFNKLIKTQLMQRAAKKYIEPILKALDEAVTEESEGGFELTQQEYARLQQLQKEQLKGFDQYAKSLMEALGIKPGSSSGLSKLQQGIQSITENTGAAIKSLLNSIRFFVAQQANDLAAIRALMDASNGSGMYNSPVLTELRNQTAILNRIYRTLTDITSPNHPKAGYGVKVFVN